MGLITLQTIDAKEKLALDRYRASQQLNKAPAQIDLSQ